MAAIIQQLWDIELGRAVSVEDVASHDLETVTLVTVTDDDGDTQRYQLYTAAGGATPYDKPTAHFKTRHNDRQPPFRLYTVEDGEKQPDLAHIAHQLATRWGEGYYRGFFIGGQPPMEYFWRYWLAEVA